MDAYRCKFVAIHTLVMPDGLVAYSITEEITGLSTIAVDKPVFDSYERGFVDKMGDIRRSYQQSDVDKCGKVRESALLYLPDTQADAAIPGHDGADKDGVVEPGVWAVGRSLEGGGGAEVVGVLAVLVAARPDDAAVADVDVHAVVRLDAVDGFEFGAVALLIDQLVVGAAAEDGAVDERALEGAAGDGDDHALAVRGGAHAEGSIDLDMELEGELKAGSIGSGGILRLSTKSEGDEKEKNKKT